MAITKKQAEIAILGGGPGGYVAAIRAAQLGMKTVLIEADRLGGICLNWGCIPTKALLESAHTLHRMRNSRRLGITAESIEVDFNRVVKHSRDAATRLSKGVEFLMKKNKVDVVPGFGTLTDAHTIRVKGKDFTTDMTAKKIILATGAKPRSIPGAKPDGERIWTAKDAMTPKNLPKSLVIIGAGAIGVEFADFYHEMGTEVTLVEMLDRILPVEDEDVSKALKNSLTKRGIKIRTGTSVTGIEQLKTKLKITIRSGDQSDTLSAERVLVAVGVTGNVEEIGLNNAGVSMEKGFIPVNEYCQTSLPHIYAIGDVSGPPWLAHVASAQGHVAVEHAAGKEAHPVHSNLIPGCTYCRPQVASMGLTEVAAREKHQNVKVGRFDFRANGKAMATGETEGFVKLVFDGTYGELVGAHILGENATELIAELNLAGALESTWDELAMTIHAHPTLSEAVMEAALDAQGMAVHH